MNCSETRELTGVKPEVPHDVQEEAADTTGLPCQRYGCAHILDG